MNITHFGTFNTQFFGLAVDTFTGSPLGINGLVQRPLAIESDTHDATRFDIDILDAVKWSWYSIGERKSFEV